MLHIKVGIVKHSLYFESMPTGLELTSFNKILQYAVLTF